MEATVAEVAEAAFRERWRALGLWTSASVIKYTM